MTWKLTTTENERHVIGVLLGDAKWAEVKKQSFHADPEKGYATWQVDENFKLRVPLESIHGLKVVKLFNG